MASHRPGAAFGDEQQVIEQEQVNGVVELAAAHGPSALGSRHLLHLTLLQQPTRVRNHRHGLKTGEDSCSLWAYEDEFRSDTRVNTSYQGLLQQLKG